MKRLCAMLLAALLLASLAFPVSAEPAAQPLTFGRFDGLQVRTIWAEYASDAPAGSLSVRFRDSIPGKAQTISNYKDGVLYVAVVSTEALDLTEPIAWVSQTDSDLPPRLTLTKLRFNEEPVSVRFEPMELSAALDGETLTASVSVSIPAPVECQMITAAYHGGRMLKMGIRNVTLNKPENTLSVTLDGCAGATEVKVFFTSEVFLPLGPALTDAI